MKIIWDPIYGACVTSVTLVFKYSEYEDHKVIDYYVSFFLFVISM